MAENKLVMEQESFAKKLMNYLKGKVHKDIKVDFHDVIRTNDVLMHSITMRKEEEAGSRRDSPAPCRSLPYTAGRHSPPRCGRWPEYSR